jgi:hypothetical protein
MAMTNSTAAPTIRVTRLADVAPAPRAPLSPDTPRRPTWDRLVELEPRLADLAAEIAAEHDEGGPVYCANRRWYGRREGGAWIPGYRAALNRLVGWYAERDHPELRTMEAHGLAYSRLYSALPDCRECEGRGRG